MKYLFGRANLSICFLISLSLLAKDKNMGGEGSAHVPDSLIQRKENTPSLVKNGGRESYSLVYMKDRYDVKDGRNIFKNNYKRHGTLLISKNRHFYKKAIRLGWGLGMGLGYNQGNPDFVSGTKSDIIFRLYTVLLDISTAGEIQPADFLKFMIKVGPSFMGLHQYRNDLGWGESGKNIYQIGLGGFAHAAVKIGMGSLVSFWGKYLYQEYQIHELFLNMGVRYQYYGGFKNSKIERVDGLSYLVGLSFEF